MRGFARLLVTLAAGAVVLSGQARAAPASDPAPAQLTVNECPPGAGAANEPEDQHLVDNAFAAMARADFQASRFICRAYAQPWIAHPRVTP